MYLVKPADIRVYDLEMPPDFTVADGIPSIFVL